MRMLTVCALAALSAAAAHAQPSKPVAPCTRDAAPYRDFDFWIGDWAVAQPDGRKAGDNLVSVRQGGCLILEEWRSARGGSGMSQNFYDPALGAWRQVWTGQGILVDMAGGLEDGAMVMAGTITYLADARTAPFRGRWVLEDDGGVRQTFWEQNRETGDWALWFEGVYEAKADR